MHPFCCVSSSMTIHGNPDMPSAPPSDPFNKSQNSTICRVLSARDPVPDHVSIGAVVNNNNHGRELKINNIVGNGVSGILYKWVNYGKGWRPRWFVLLDGVLSFYKIHGPDRIVVNQDTERGSRVIGEESIRRMSRHHKDHHHHHHNHHRNGDVGSSAEGRKPVGEVHLKV